MEIVAEEWKRLEGEASNYEVSSLGALRIVGSTAPRPQYNDKDGYKLAVIKCSATGKNKTRRVHRLIAKAFIPRHHGKETVNHKNGIKYDNRAENLEWVTEKENRRHAIQTGLVRIRKLTNEQAEEIRELRRQRISCTVLAREFGVSDETIRMIGTQQQYQYEAAM